MPTAAQIAVFADVPTPPGASPFVAGQGPQAPPPVVPPDPAWPGAFEELAARVRQALGPRVLDLQHVGSTAVPGLAAKPVIDLDLVVADPAAEAAYVPALVAVGFELRVREPWWHEHRLLRATDPLANLHVFGPDSPEPWRHRLFRDWLRTHPDDRARYAAAKQAAWSATDAVGGDVEAYNRIKEPVLREIWDRLALAAGLRP